MNEHVDAEIRDATVADLDQLDTWLALADTRWNASDLRDDLSHSARFIRVVQAGERLVGFYYSSRAADEESLRFIYVDTGFRRQGYAKVLMEDLGERASSARCDLYLEVRRSNAAAIALYQRERFEVDGVRSGYYPVRERSGELCGREDALLMVRRWIEPG